MIDYSKFTKKDLISIAEFNKIVKNYLKICKLLEENNYICISSSV